MADTRKTTLIAALNRCSQVANALNPKDPMRADVAHKELWDALRTVSEWWPVSAINHTGEEE